VPSLTSVNVSVADVSVTPARARSVTALGGGGGGGVVTVMVAAPLFPSLVAVTATEPAVPAVTRPVPLTVAIPGLLLVQVTGRPDSGFPFASFGVAVNWIVWATVRLADAGLIATDATGTALTANAAVPLCPSLVAVTVAEPAALAVTKPLPVTVATAPLLLAHVTGRPESGFPFPSFGVAVN